MFSQMTMGKKLMVTAALLLSCVAALSFMAFTGLRSTREDLEEATKHTARKLELALHIKESTARLMIGTRSIEIAVATKNKEDENAERANFDKVEKTLQAQIQEIRPLLTTERGKAGVKLY